MICSIVDGFVIVEGVDGMLSSPRWFARYLLLHHLLTNNIAWLVTASSAMPERPSWQRQNKMFFVELMR